jgi:hypothetical protein
MLKLQKWFKKDRYHVSLVSFDHPLYPIFDEVMTEKTQNSMYELWMHKNIENTENGNSLLEFFYKVHVQFVRIGAPSV